MRLPLCVSAVRHTVLAHLDKSLFKNIILLLNESNFWLVILPMFALFRLLCS